MTLACFISVDVARCPSTCCGRAWVAAFLLWKHPCLLWWSASWWARAGVAEQGQCCSWRAAGDCCRQKLSAKDSLLPERAVNCLPVLFTLFEPNIQLKLCFSSLRSTAEVENFNSLILMYAGKRFSYSPPVYRARNLLAAIDYNSHLDRDQLTTKEGVPR